jgi:hypothetical protein
MKLKITDTAKEYSVRVLDDTGRRIRDELTHRFVEWFPQEAVHPFKYNGEWYLMFPPVCGADSNDWKWRICKLQPQDTPIVYQLGQTRHRTK